MRCPHCDFDNPEGMKFCGECGSALKNRCLQCGFENPPRFKFCGECGSPLTAPKPSEPVAETPAPPPAPLQTSLRIALPHEPLPVLPDAARLQPPRPVEGLPYPFATTELLRSFARPQETAAKLMDSGARSVGPAPPPRTVPEVPQRLLTALFADLVPTAATRQALQAEELKKVVWVYQSACADVIQNLDGHLAQYIGNSLLAYFGFPLAKEDDALRAVQAALAIREVLATTPDRLGRYHNVRFGVRIGIHTASIAMEEIDADAGAPQLAVGTTPLIAARLQTLAPLNTLVISAATAQYVRERFPCQDLGFHTVKELAQPVALFQVLTDPDREGQRGKNGVPASADQEMDMEVVRERWAQACAQNVHRLRMG